MAGQADNKLPQEFPHIFTEVVFQLIPEVHYNDLVYLSQLLKMNKKEEIYRSLLMLCVRFNGRSWLVQKQ